MLQNDRIPPSGRRPRRVLGFLVLAVFAGACALSPVSTPELLREPAATDDAGDLSGDDEAPARVDAGRRSGAGIDESAADDTDEPVDDEADPAERPADAGKPDAGADAGAAVVRDAGAVVRDAGAADAGRTTVDAGGAADAGARDAGIGGGTGTPTLPACRSANECAPSTCPAFGSLPCCKANGTCGCRPVFASCG